MRKLMLLASAAMLLIGQAALAQGKGQGQGKGSGGGGGQAAHQGGGGGGGKGRGGGQEARGRGGDRGDRGRGQQARGGGRPDRPDRVVVERGRGRDDRMRVVEDRGGGRGRGRDDRVVRVDRIDDGVRRVAVVDRGFGRFIPAFAPGCPPGLAKKGNGCLPPGQAKKIYGDPFTSMFRYAPWYGRALDDDWFYMNGYAYRLDPGSGLINSFLPLLGGSLFPGSVWPVGYTDYRIDPYYPRFYGNYYGDAWDDYDYRYVDGALFAVDPRTQRIDAITALLAGDPWAVGRPMPQGYYTYNVPPPYRARYYDGPDHWYRYSDGYIYDIDPTTQLVAAVISLLA